MCMTERGKDDTHVCLQGGGSVIKSLGENVPVVFERKRPNVRVNGEWSPTVLHVCNNGTAHNVLSRRSFESCFSRCGCSSRHPTKSRCERASW